MDALSALYNKEEKFQTDCLTALELDFSGYTCTTSSIAHGFLSAKLFSRFGGLTREIERTTIAGFRDRNRRAGLRTFSDEKFCTEYADFRYRSVYPEPKGSLYDRSKVNKDLFSNFVAEARIALNTLRFQLHRWAKATTYGEVIFDFPATGPGSTGQVRNNTSAIAKLFWHDQTVGGVRLYKHYVNLLHTMTGELSIIPHLERQRVRSYRTQVRAQELTVIAKNATSGRIIMPQNGIDLFCQKELGSRMTRALLGVLGVNLSTAPDLNADAARRGSINNGISTIDLRSASDFGLNLVDFLLTAEICQEIRACRNGHFRARGDKRDSIMHIVAGMGNDFCFPLQTAIFTCIARTAALCSEASLRESRSFGDDIVVPDEATDRCLALLHALGMDVNTEKSFTQPNNVRESCGGYYHYGRDIRPFRVDGLTPSDLTVALNAVVEYTAGTGFALKRLYSVLLEYGATATPVPMHADPRSGLRVPFDYRYYCDRERFLHTKMHGGFVLAELPVVQDVSSSVYTVGDPYWLEAANAAVRLNVRSHGLTTMISTFLQVDDAVSCTVLGYSYGYTRPHPRVVSELCTIAWDGGAGFFPFELGLEPCVRDRSSLAAFGERAASWRTPLDVGNSHKEQYKTSRTLVKYDILVALVELEG